MTRAFSRVSLVQLFTVNSGNFHAVKELDPGDIPLVSCGDEGNGVIGHYDIPARYTYSQCITVAYNGSWPLTAKFHPYSFGAKDDVAVLVPRTPLSDATLLYVASLLNGMTWRYSYGRKCFREKLKHVKIDMPVVHHDGELAIDEPYIHALFPRDVSEFLPAKAGPGIRTIPHLDWHTVSITEILHLKRGDFHSIAALSPGEYTTVSRISVDNGVVGHYEPPDDATVYSAGHITVSTVGGDAFVQIGDFIATDNVVVCSPKKPMALETLFFIAFVLNQQRWRYGYGRQCYLRKLQRVTLPLPLLPNGDIDDDSIRKITSSAEYWPLVKSELGHWSGLCTTSKPSPAE